MIDRKFVDVFAEQQRILILQMLNKDADNRLNNLLLQRGLEMFGHNVTLDKVNTECAWLSDQGLVAIEDINERIKVVSITEAGSDVANSRRIVPGIDKPVRGF